MELIQGLGFRVVISGIMSGVTILITPIRGLLAPLITTHEPPQIPHRPSAGHGRQEDKQSALPQVRIKQHCLLHLLLVSMLHATEVSMSVHIWYFEGEQ